ncbi:hypothetical protein ACKWTF_005423 [Chironomus riparius]
MTLLVISILVILTAYFVNKYFLNFWTRHGFPQLNPKFLVGDAGSLLIGKIAIPDYVEDLYQKTKHLKCVGAYNFYRPVLYVNDPEIIQNVLIRDFNNFHDRGIPIDEENDPLSGHLFSLEGQKWRDLRIKLSPTFTSGKMKNMFSIIQDCCKVLEEYVEKNVKNSKNSFDIKNLFGRYNTNVISSVAFGIENDCINDPKNLFYHFGMKVFQPSFKTTLLNLAFMIAPSLMKTFHIKLADDDVEKFFINTIRETVDYRERSNFKRNDFMNLLIQLKNQGYISADKNENTNELNVNQQNLKKLSLNEISAQAFVFFLASLETSGSTMTFCLFEIAKNPSVQQKVQEEIDTLIQSGEDISYDSISKLKYLECCIDETLRKYMPVPILVRECIRDYKIPNTDLVIPKGTNVQIPMYALHRDPEIYDNPLEFKPERFLNSSNGGGKLKNGIFYAPFGDGPRNCIGMRMGKMMTKIGLFTLLSKYSFDVVDKKLLYTEIEFKINQFSVGPKDALNLRATKRFNIV